MYLFVRSFAQKIIRNANEITHADVDALRALGLEDVEILDITLTATMRSFASKTFDALGAGPDAVYKELEGQLSDLLPAYDRAGKESFIPYRGYPDHPAFASGDLDTLSGITVTPVQNGTLKELKKWDRF